MADREPRWRFLLLTLSLCAWMFLSPHLGDRWIVQLVLQLFLIHFVVVTLWANPRWGRMRQALVGFWLLALLGAASTLLPMGRESHDLARIAHSVAMIPLLVLLAEGILRYVFARRQRTRTAFSPRWPPTCSSPLPSHRSTRYSRPSIRRASRRPCRSQSAALSRCTPT